jgi:hypothetical protein
MARDEGLTMCGMGAARGRHGLKVSKRQVRNGVGVVA